MDSPSIVSNHGTPDRTSLHLRSSQTSINSSPNHPQENVRSSPTRPSGPDDEKIEHHIDYDDQDDSADNSSADEYVPAEVTNGRVNLSPNRQFKNRTTR